MPKYYCFCGKFLNPELDRDCEPHSCGKICNKKRGVYCQHPCPDICHRGKCKPCDFEGANVTCQCGKSQRLVKCS
jgi:transcriptional repressor NF-X1